MNQTNYLLYDFLDFEPEDFSGKNKKLLWKAGKPTAISEDQGTVILSIPYYCQLPQLDLLPDPAVSSILHHITIRAYGDKILRFQFGSTEKNQQDSPMLVSGLDQRQTSLSIEKKEFEWIITDKNNKTRARISLRHHPVDVWSELLPKPEESLELEFYPDGNKAVRIHAYDQFFPARQDAIALGYTSEEDVIKQHTLSFHASPNEKFVGTGERFGKMDLSGKTFQLKNQDGQGVNNRRTYKNIPFYLSSELYGMFLHTSAYTKLSMADHSTRSVQLMVEDDQSDVFLMGGENPEEILYQYRTLTGFPAPLPLWSFGVWMSRMTYFSADEVTEICDRLRREKFPCDVIHLDTGWFRTDWLCEWKFNAERFPDPKEFIEKLRKSGYRVSLWQMPYIAKEAEQHDLAKAKNYMGTIRKTEEQGGSNFSALDYAGTIDFTYPEAVDWYKSLLRELLEMGVVCIKTDFGEEIHLDATYQGMDARLLNNLYALLYQKAAFEVTKEVTGEGIIWARAGWAGCQRYPLHWGGDAAATWDGLAGSLKGGLHLGLSGFGFWSHDVPGFHGLPDFMNAVIPDELYLRWTQFGVFTSHIRYHGTSKREPYHFPKIADTIRNWWNLRYALIPYIMEQAEKTTRTGYPLLRALLIHHPKDTMCWHVDDQYYFGDDFMVAPIMNETNRREVYLPEGDWVHFFSGEKVTGNQWLKSHEESLENMPVWVKKGTQLPLYPDSVNCTDEMDLTKTTSITIDDSFNGIWDIIPNYNKTRK